MKIIIIFLSSVSLIFAQTKNEYTQFSGKNIQLNYTQVSDNQEFCTYEKVEKAEHFDVLWGNVVKKEVQKYNGADSVKIIPIHRFVFETKQKKYLFLKFSIEQKNKKPIFVIKNFQQNNSKNWVEYTTSDAKVRALSYVFEHIKTDVFQKLFSGDDIKNEPLINNLKNKVLGSDGYVNFDELYRQLINIKDQSVFRKLCN